MERRILRSACRAVAWGSAIGVAPGLVLLGLVAASGVFTCAPGGADINNGSGCRYDHLILSLVAISIASTGGLLGALVGSCFALRKDRAHIVRGAYWLVALGFAIGIVPGLVLINSVMGLSNCEGGYQAGLYGGFGCRYDRQILWLFATFATSTGGLSGSSGGKLACVQANPESLDDSGPHGSRL